MKKPAVGTAGLGGIHQCKGSRGTAGNAWDEAPHGCHGN